jgi:hypothetical protein
MNRRPLRLALALLLAGSSALAQDPPKPEPEKPVIHVPLPGAQDDLQQQILKLFGEVETRLREIDKLLSEAAAGERGVRDAQKPLEKSAAGIGALVQRTQTEGKAVVEAIDKILELAAQQQAQQSQGGGSGMGSSSQGQGNSQGGQTGQQGETQGKSPLDGQRDTTTQREGTPDKPGAQKGEKPQGAQADPNGNPRGNQKTGGDPKNTAGKTPPGQATEKAAHGDSRDSWGYLPEHARDVFRTQGGGQMPARYREWIDAYYKRLNQKP